MKMRGRDGHEDALIYWVLFWLPWVCAPVALIAAVACPFWFLRIFFAAGAVAFIWLWFSEFIESADDG